FRGAATHRQAQCKVCRGILRGKSVVGRGATRARSKSRVLGRRLDPPYGRTVGWGCMPRDWRSHLRRRCYEILERGAVGDRTSLLVDRLLILLILVNLVAVALESMPALATRYGPWFDAIELA